MATTSTALPLGSALPPAVLLDAVGGKPTTVAAGAHGTLIMFICNHCPYVVHVRAELARVAHEALGRGVSVYAINSNSLRSHPQDGPPHMAALARAEGWKFPFLFDETQAVARAFGAQCTPELFLFDARAALVYHGQLDDSRPGNGKPVNGADLRAALEAMLANQPPLKVQKPAIGCGIKWG